MRARGGSIAIWFWLALSLVPACRYGFEQLDVKGSGGSSSGAGANGGSVSAGASGGTSGSMQGGEPGMAGEAGSIAAGGAGVSGAAGFPDSGGGAGAAGAAGATSTPGCSSTAECSCAALQGHSYWFCTTPSNFDVAQAHCQTQAMQLARIDSQTENDFLLDTGTTLGVFAGGAFTQIGANDQAVAGEWRWLDGEQFWQGASNGSAAGGLYSHWASASPSAQGTKRCAGMLSTGFWQDRSCTALATFVCEAP